MELTGKCNSDFYIWLEAKMDIDHAYNDYLDSHYIPDFVELPEAMRWGVYVDFFDSKNICIHTGTWMSCGVNKTFHYWFNLKDKEDGYLVDNSLLEYLKDTLEESRTAALEKANDLYNSNI